MSEFPAAGAAASGPWAPTADGSPAEPVSDLGTESRTESGTARATTPATAPRQDADIEPALGSITESAGRPRWLGWETVLLLGLSLGRSGVDSVVSLIDKLTQPTALSAQSSVLNGTYVQDRTWLDFIYQVVGLAEGFVAPALALLLLARSPAGRGFAIGFTRSRLRRDSFLGAGFAALIGIPGLGLVYLAHSFGFNTQIVASGLPDVWYRLPVLVVSALQNATSEEVIVMGYLLTRLAQLGWTRERSILSAAVLRGSYHLYQGFGGFAGNAVMGLIFGWWFTRTRRVLPLLVAHFIIDTISFVGYVYLSPHISWI